MKVEHVPKFDETRQVRRTVRIRDPDLAFRKRSEPVKSLCSRGVTPLSSSTTVARERIGKLVGRLLVVYTVEKKCFHFEEREKRATSAFAKKARGSKVKTPSPMFVYAHVHP